MKARFTYNIVLVFPGVPQFKDGKDWTFHGTATGYDQLDALSNAKWMNPTAKSITIYRDETVNFSKREWSK